MLGTRSGAGFRPCLVSRRAKELGNRVCMSKEKKVGLRGIWI